MQTFLDSSSIVDQRDALRERLAEEGYLFFRRLIDPQEIFELRRLITEQLAPLGWLAPDRAPFEGYPGPIVQNTEVATFWEGFAAVQRLEAFHRLAHHPQLLGTLRTLVSDDIFTFPRKLFRITYPYAMDDHSTTVPHQDYRYNQGTSDVFTVWIPLGDCPRSVGGLKVLRGSHLQGLLASQGPGSPHRCATLPIDASDPNWVGVDYEAGDVLIFHSLTVHAGIDNLSDRLRLSVDYRYQSASEPMCQVQLDPAYYPKVPGWNQLSENWSDRSWISLPENLVLTDFAAPDMHLELPPSRFFGELSH